MSSDNKTKHCSKCNNDLPLSDFYVRRTEDGEVPQGACKVCTLGKLRAQEIECKEWSDKYKEGKDCENCHRTDVPIQWVFRDPADKEKVPKRGRRGISQLRDLKALQDAVQYCKLICRNCHREEMEEGINKDNRKDKELLQLVDAEKFRRGACYDCGKKVTPENLTTFEYDHILPKLATISTMRRRGMSPEEITHEMTKCVLRCSNCHYEKSKLDQKLGLEIPRVERNKPYSTQRPRSKKQVKHIGVMRAGNKFTVQMRLNGKLYTFGTYNTIEEAAITYNIGSKILLADSDKPPRQNEVPEAKEGDERMSNDDIKKRVKQRLAGQLHENVEHKHVRKATKSRFHWINLNRQSNRWNSCVNFRGKAHFLSTFDHETDAALCSNFGLEIAKKYVEINNRRPLNDLSDIPGAEDGIGMSREEIRARAHNGIERALARLGIPMVKSEDAEMQDSDAESA